MRRILLVPLPATFSMIPFLPALRAVHRRIDLKAKKLIGSTRSSEKMCCKGSWSEVIRNGPAPLSRRKPLQHIADNVNEDLLLTTDE